MSALTLTEYQFDVLTDAVGTKGEVSTDYSGRFMYGDECVGITLPSVDDFSLILVNVAFEDNELAAVLAESQRSDSMGLGVIVYFPGVKAPEQEDDE